MCLISSETLEDKHQGTQSRAPPSPSYSQGHSFREIIAPRTLLLHRILPPRDPSFMSRASRSQQPTSWCPPTFMESVTPPGHLTFQIATTLTSVQTITEGSRNHSRNKEYNSVYYERIATCRSCSYWNLQPMKTPRVCIHWEINDQRGGDQIDQKGTTLEENPSQAPNPL